MRSNNWDKYYTPISLSTKIVNAIDNTFVPKSVIDICVGSGNMLKAAKSRWPDSNFYGIDINISEKIYDINFKVQLLEFNALDQQRMQRELTIPGPKLVLANPPFGQTNEISPPALPEFKAIYSEAKKTQRIESLLLVSNLSLMKEGDFFGAILPENLFSAERMRSFKEYFLSYFENINIELNKSSFVNSEVRTRLFVGRFKGTLNRGGSLISIVKYIAEIKERFPLIRGINNSQLINSPKDNKEYNKVFHFDLFKGLPYRYKYVKEESQTIEDKIIKENDLLVVRVGRNAGTIIVPDHRHFGYLYSDLYINIRVGNNFLSESVDELRDLLIVKRKGLTINYVTKEDIWKSISILLEKKKGCKK